MTLTKEKKLVAEWMGWHWNDVWNTICTTLDESPKNAMLIVLWNPQSERNCWDEIWANMTLGIADRYMSNLNGTMWEMHTAKPEVCWKALIKTLEEM